ncbi:hypothetical protein MJO29_000314, partial [Puccinia striiformis f. sp. tritici]
MYRCEWGEKALLIRRAACSNEQSAGRNRVSRRESVSRTSRTSRISEERLLGSTLLNLSLLHRVRLLSDLINQPHELLKPTMKRFIITLVLCWTAFASLLGAMNVMREGTEVKPAIVEEAAPA